MPDATPVAPPRRWGETILTILQEGCPDDRRSALEFLALRSRVDQEEGRALLPLLQPLVFDPEAETRFFARKAVQRLVEAFPALQPEKPAPGELPAPGEPLPTRDVLLRKIRLGSRYVVFEALERLTESRDPGLADPLLDFLQQETDLYKISFLLKRLVRLPDSRIPGVVMTWLDHSDFRVVANALEGLAELDRPDLKDRFAALADSPDHRVRAAAIRGLFRHDRPAAANRLRAMMATDSLALQESGMHVLRQVMGPDLEDLVEMAAGSRFPSIRLLALEITRPPTKAQGVPGPAPAGLAGSSLTAGGLTEAQRERGLIAALALAVVLMAMATMVTRGTLFNVYLIGACGFVLWHRRSEGAFARAVASAAFIACLVWGDVRYLPMVGLLAIWLPVVGGRERPWRTRLAAWAFAGVAVGLCHLFRDESSHTLDLVAALVTPGRQPDEALAGILVQMERFRWMLFGGISFGVVLLLKLDRWFPVQNDPQVGRKRLMITLGVGLLVLLVLLISQKLSLRMTLGLYGMGSPNQILRHLGD
ncbi:MAG: HEAT repeat domain-containing protein [Candidatus Riflebacteria bacterium]|nr:HEAT repeat domain-containing protein [Candidatus Riflebacteria bacterium]